MIPGNDVCPCIDGETVICHGIRNELLDIHAVASRPRSIGDGGLERYEGSALMDIRPPEDQTPSGGDGSRVSVTLSEMSDTLAAIAAALVAMSASIAVVGARTVEQVGQGAMQRRISPARLVDIMSRAAGPWSRAPRRYGSWRSCSSPMPRDSSRSPGPSQDAGA